MAIDQQPEPKARSWQSSSVFCATVALEVPQSSRLRLVLTSRTCGRDRYLSKLHYLRPDKAYVQVFAFLATRLECDYPRADSAVHDIAIGLPQVVPLTVPTYG